jgi:hypothetical protein
VGPAGSPAGVDEGRDVIYPGRRTERRLKIIFYAPPYIFYEGVLRKYTGCGPQNIDSTTLG